MKRNHPRNPFNSAIVDDRLWAMLWRYAEWRSVRGCPRSIRMPEPTMRWELVRGSLISEEGYCLEHSTKPPEVGRLEIFGQAFRDLEELDQKLLIAVIDLQHEPWLRGERWAQWFQFLGVSKKNFARLLESALLCLSLFARHRGLLTRP